MISSSGFVTQPPDNDLPVASQSTLLLQKKKEMQEVQQQLDRKKEEFRSRMQRCQEKEVDLAARQEDIKEQVRKFDKFLKDNDAKRVRADRKVQEEKKARDQKEMERLDLLEQKRLHDEKRAELKAGLESAGKYQRFLDSVCEDPSMSEYFEGIENITMRYETLKDAHDTLRERVDAATQEMEAQNNELMHYIKKTTNDLLVFNSDIATKQQTCDKLRLQAQTDESKVSGKFTQNKEAIRSLGEVKMAIENIFGRAFEKGKKKTSSFGSDLDTLEAIKQRVVDLQWIERTLSEKGFGRKAADAQMGASATLPGSTVSLDDPAGKSGKVDAARAGGGGSSPSGDGPPSSKLRSSRQADGSSALQSSAPQSQAGSATLSGPASKTMVPPT